MAFTFSGTSGTNSATITQTGNYLTITVTTAVTTSGANWSFVGTIGGTVQSGASVSDAVGRAIVNQTKATTITASKQIASSWISSISSVTANATSVTVTGPRYFLADGTEDVFVAAVGDVFAVCQNERDLVAAATTDTNFLVDTSTNYASLTSARADLPWGVGKPNLIRLGTNAQATKLVLNGYFCISDNTHIMWAQNGNVTPDPSGATLTVSGASSSAFLMGRHYTLAVGSGYSTRLLYPGIALTSDTQARTHVAAMNVFVDNGAYLYLGGTVGGAAYGISTWTRDAACRMHFRKCQLWSVGNTTGTSTGPTIFAGSASGVSGVFSCDELTLLGSHVLQREGMTMNVYSITNAGGGINQTLNTNAFTLQGYSNAGSQNGFDFGGWRGYATSSGGTNASIFLSYNSPAGTNCYVGSADLTFNTGNNQNINIEFHRNLTLRATNASGTLLSTPTAYLKDVTRTVTTTAANPRGAVLSAPDGTQATCGQTVTSRSGTTVLTDGIQVQYDRTYTAQSGAAIDVLLGECYTNNSTVATTTSRVGRPGYEGNSGLATNRISRRGKDDTIASRNNRDNYDVYWWDYNYQFGKASDYSLNANGTQTQIMLTDTNVTQTDSTTVAAYTALDTTAKVYDYFKYYKTATGTVDGRTQLARLELGGVDGSTPGSSLVNGGGGYLCYTSGSSLLFNPIFNAVTINGGTNATPVQIGSGAQGPISGSWNGTTYTYGNAARSTSVATTQGSLTMYAGAAGAISGTNTLDFGTRSVTLASQATSVNGFAPIRADTITLGNPGTSASWTTNGVVGTGTGSSMFTATVPTGLTPPATVTVGPVTLTGVAATDTTLIRNAFAGSILGTPVVTLNASGGTAATVVYTIPSGTYRALGGITAPFSSPSDSLNLTITYPAIAGPETEQAMAVYLTSAFSGNTAFNALWSAAASGGGVVTLTRRATGGISAVTASVSGITAVSGGPAPTTGVFTNGATTGTLTATFTIPGTPTAGVVPTSALTLTSSLATYITSTSAATNLVNSVASSPPSTLYQPVSATTSIVDLLTSGTVCSGVSVGFGTSSAITMTGNLTFDLSNSASLTGSLALTPGAAGRSIVFTNASTSQLSSLTLSNTTPASVITVTGWPTGLTLPTGFVQLATFTLTLTFPVNTAQSAFKAVKIYTLDSSGNATAITPTGSGFGSTTVTYNFGVNTLTQAVGCVFFVDGYQRAAATTVVGATSLNVLFVPEQFIDFTLWSSYADATDIAFANGATFQWNTTTATELDIRWPSTGYTKAIPTGVNAVEWGKILLRRAEESSANATFNNDNYYVRMANSQRTASLFSYNSVGIEVLTASSYSLTSIKSSATNNYTNIPCYSVNSGGSFYSLNTTDGTTAASVQQSIDYGGFSPGAVANISQGQQDAIASTVSSTLVGTAVVPGALSKLNNGVKSASLLVPWSQDLY